MPMTDPHSIDSPPAGLIPLSEARARVFVWSVWSACLLSAVVFIGAYRANAPLMHDFDMIPALTGNEPVTLGYLWEATNEHRMFLPKLLIVGLGKLTNCDFRAEKFFHVGCLAAVSLAMILAARRLRGRTSFADAFFPILLLSLGNCVACVETLAHVLEGAIPCLALLIVLLHGDKFTWKSTALFGTCLLLLPLCGSGGVVYVPAFVLVLLYAAVIRIRRGGPGTRRDVSLMLGFAAAAMFLVVLYFYGFSQRDLPRPIPSVASNFFGFFAMSVGAGGEHAWKIVSAVVLLLVAIASGLLLRIVITERSNRLRALALLGFLGSTAVLAFAIAWSRACLGPCAALSIRFSVLATPVLCAVFLAFQLYGKRPLAFGFQCALLALVIAALPCNVKSGMVKGRYDRAVTDNLLRDVKAGLEPNLLVTRNPRLHPRKKPERTAQRLEMLLVADVGPFGPDYRQNIRAKDRVVADVQGRRTLESTSRQQPDLGYKILAADGENEQRIACPDGTTVNVRPEQNLGHVDTVYSKSPAVFCKGWAADVAKGIPVDSVLIFIEEKCRFRCDMKDDCVYRPGVARTYQQPNLTDVGFETPLPENWFAGVDPEDVRFFAVRGDVASELTRSKEFWKVPTDSPAMRTAQGNAAPRR